MLGRVCTGVLLGCKSDMAGFAEVDAEEALQFAEEHELAHFTCSAVSIVYAI